ncbi:hypothetical protein ACIP88_15130 [Streptomyces uncialis]|uniref:hypothetical protein n=1 Tax=Streptomyces uncialis TaxID=1048205 RepID=UPI0037F1A0B7
MTRPAPYSRPTPDRPAPLWVVSVASLAVFLVTWTLSWVKAYLVNDDLPGFCADVRRGSFPPEVSCVAGDGSVSGANAWWVDPLFYASGGVGLAFGALACAIAAGQGPARR